MYYRPDLYDLTTMQALGQIIEPNNCIDDFGDDDEWPADSPIGINEVDGDPDEGEVFDLSYY